MNRGDRREAIFLDDVDHRRFLETLEEGCIKADWQVPPQLFGHLFGGRYKTLIMDGGGKGERNS
jgi:hypothetical protein